MNKTILFVVALLLAFALGMLSYGSWKTSRTITDKEATVLLERMRDVCKLVTVEGDLSELYNETSTREVTLYLPLPTQFNFDKKATVQVIGKVLVGYDLREISLDLNVTDRILTIGNIPEPSILAVDHEVQYRYLEESWFNEFTPKDYTELNASAKEFLRQRAEESDLIDRAEERGLGMIETVRYLAEAAGLEVVVLDTPPTPPNG